MRIFELTGYKNKEETKDVIDGLRGLEGRGFKAPNPQFRKKTLTSFISTMESKGYKSLGHGCFGAVLTHPNLNYAIKIFKNDPAYVAFMKYALANQSNPMMPKFRGKFINLDKENEDFGYYAVRIELLQKVSGEKSIEALMAILVYLAEQGLNSEHNFDTVDGYLNFVINNPAIARDMAQNDPHYYDCSLQDVVRVAKNLQENPLPVQTTIDLKKLGQNRGFNMDICYKNFMQRGSQLVITDPLWDENSI